MRDLYNNVAVRPVIAPVSVADTTAQVGAIIDRLAFEKLVYVIAVGTLVDTDATFTVLVEEGDAADMSDHAAVADNDLLGTEAAASFDHTMGGTVRKIGYIGNKRYSRVTITPTGNTGAAPMSVVAVLGGASSAPVA